MTKKVHVLSEPSLEFRYGQAVVDPHDGLTLFGPFDTDQPTHPSSISYALIGTKKGAESFLAFTRKWIGAIHTPQGSDARIWPIFPGFEAAFGCEWPNHPSKCFEIGSEKLENASRDFDPNKRANSVVNLYVDEIARIQKADERIDVVICVVPETVYQRCRPKSRIDPEIGRGRRPTRKEIQERKAGQTDLFGSYDPKIYGYSPDFRRQIKARSMKYGIPIQIIRETTLVLTDKQVFGERGVTCMADRAWNMGLGLYYKAGGKPWRLHSAREGVSYIGLAYRRENPNSSSSTASCAAQMFLDSGDGIVFMGEYGPWYTGKKGSFHLTREAAQSLLKGTLKTYEELEGQPLREIFLHCRSGINEAEFAGFSEACPKNVKLVGIRVRQNRGEVRLLREGTYPVLRGTLWKVNEKTAYLWASGFKGRLATYDGWEIPVPLRIDVQHGQADILQVAKDILGLTKLNYNACRLGDSEPVTIGFSDKVGEILISNPSAKNRKPNFKYYI